MMDRATAIGALAINIPEKAPPKKPSNMPGIMSIIVVGLGIWAAPKIVRWVTLDESR